jgi:adenylylsulfate kinase
MAFVLWMTGLPCSGKTTLARALQPRIQNLAVLDGDELREWLSPKDFSREGRNEHNRRVAHLAKLLVKHGVPACVSLISPFRENREAARKVIGRNFIEVYVRCPLDVCETRDVKGMYKKARKNEIANFTGVSDPYEAPNAPDLTIDTCDAPIEDGVQAVLGYLCANGMFPLAKSATAA